ncbi:ATP-binding protein, partial [Streptomyces bacillaris]|uniref:ATP-binding protein n=1 Tax=Streptomyces bacillaris TaxID=68179 RepID=UPI0036DF6F7B
MRIDDELGTLPGRREECADLDRLLAAAASGRSGVLVLRGEAGVGKTALIDFAARRAAGFAVVRATGVESEFELAHGVLQQVCAPL